MGGGEDKESDERRQSRSVERDRGKRRRRHRSDSPSPPKQRRKCSRSPSLEEKDKHRHRDKKDIITTEPAPPSKEPDLEDDPKKINKEDRKLERHSGVTSDDVSEDSSSDSDRKRRSRHHHKHHRKSSKSSKHRRHASEEDESMTEGTSGESSEDSEEEYRRAKRRKRLKQKEKDELERKEERRRKKEKKRKLKEKEREQEKKKKKKEKVEKRAKGPITESWGKYGIIKELDMWTRRPEFSAWLAEVKKVNLETLTNREEKDMFKQYMEDYNTATFPSKKYYNIDIYHRRKTTKQRLKGMKDVMNKKTERTEFNDEEQRRQELMAERAKQKETELDKIKRTMMETGMGKAMREQAVLREEMQYHYRLGNTEAAEKIQRRLEPDVPGALFS